jgi:hypothetical protein
MEKKIIEADKGVPAITSTAASEWKEYKKDAFGMAAPNLVSTYKDTPAKAPPKPGVPEPSRKSPPAKSTDNKNQDPARKAPPAPPRDK